MANEGAGSLLASQPSGSGLQVTLHPLPILSLSDLITRAVVRRSNNPVVIALLGQQNGLAVTVEESFDCAVIYGGGADLTLDDVWFRTRLEQMRLVYTKPQLELVGWAALVPETGPTDACLAIQKYLMNNFSDSIILVGLHPEKIVNPAGGKLPITIYDSTIVTQDQAKGASEDETMRDGDADVPASDRNAKAELRFHELPYSIETGEAEMIGMQFVHRGAANASASASAGKATAAESDIKGKGKARLEPETEAKVPLADGAVLTSEESDLIAALTSKRNAILMLKKRVDLFITYLQRLPSDGAKSGHVNNAVGAVQELASLPPTAPSNTILRAIQALNTNLTLLAPTSSLTVQPAAQEPQVSRTRARSTFHTEMLREANDVHLVSLLGDVLQSLDEVREVGKQFSVVDGARAAYRARMPGDDGGRLLGASNPGDLAHILH